MAVGVSLAERMRAVGERDSEEQSGHLVLPGEVVRSGGWAGRGLMLAGVGLVPWVAILATTLPVTYTAQHWRLAWVGFDLLAATGLLASALLVRRASSFAGLVSAVTATLLVVDMWFDITTAAGDDVVLAVVQGGLELTLAVLCGVVAVRQTLRFAPADASSIPGGEAS